MDMCSLEDRDARRFVELCHDRKLPVLAAVSREAVTDYDPSLNADEMVVCPVAEGELTARVKQAMYRVSGPAGPKLLRAGDLSIDMERYEVTVAGRRVSLTYKEFQLLVLLASNPGRVYTRDALLSQIWGYGLLRRHPHRGRSHQAAPLQGGVSRPLVRGDHLERWLPVQGAGLDD